MIEFLAAFRQVRKQMRDKRRKDEEFRKLRAAPLNYMIIQDLVNAARHDVKIDVVLSDGSRFTISRVDAFDKLQEKPRDGLW